MVEGKLVTGDSLPTAKVDRWRAVLDGATALFAQRGFARVSVQEIAGQTQTHKATVLYQFETHGGLGFTEEVGLISQRSGARLFKTAPVSREMILNYVAEWDLGLPKSY